jgi:hypothetical protein
MPLVVAGATAAYVLAGVGLWVLLGNTTAQTAQIVLVVLMGLLGLVVLQQFLVWLTAILSRVSLRPEAELEGVTTDAVIESVLASMPVPR